MFRHKYNKYHMVQYIFSYFCIRNLKSTDAMHYLKRLEEAIKKNWDRPALGNFRGETFTFGDFATQIA